MPPKHGNKPRGAAPEAKRTYYAEIPEGSHDDYKGAESRTITQYGFMHAGSKASPPDALRGTSPEPRCDGPHSNPRQLAVDALGVAAERGELREVRGAFSFKPGEHMEAALGRAGGEGRKERVSLHQQYMRTREASLERHESEHRKATEKEGSPLANTPEHLRSAVRAFDASFGATSHVTGGKAGKKALSGKGEAGQTLESGYDQKSVNSFTSKNPGLRQEFEAHRDNVQKALKPYTGRKPVWSLTKVSPKKETSAARPAGKKKK